MLGFKGLNGHPWDQKRPPINRGVCKVADPGEGPGGGPTPPYFWTKLRPEEPKKFLGGTGPPLSQGLDDCPRLLSEGQDFLVMYAAGTMIKCPPTAGFIVIFNDNNNIYRFVLRKYQPGKKKFICALH